MKQVQHMKQVQQLKLRLFFLSGLLLALSANAQNAQVGQIKIESAYTRATVPGQKVAGGFMKIIDQEPRQRCIHPQKSQKQGHRKISGLLPLYDHRA